MITYIFKYMYRFLNFTFSESIQYILFLHGQYPALEYQVQFKPTLDPTGVHISRSTWLSIYLYFNIYIYLSNFTCIIQSASCAAVVCINAQKELRRE